MNTKGTAVIAVAFPGGVAAKAIVSEYPEGITIFCIAKCRCPCSGPPNEPDIDVEVRAIDGASEGRRKFSVRGKGIHAFWDQITFVLSTYLAAKREYGIPDY